MEEDLFAVFGDEDSAVAAAVPGKTKRAAEADRSEALPEKRARIGEENEPEEVEGEEEMDWEEAPKGIGVRTERVIKNIDTEVDEVTCSHDIAFPEDWVPPAKPTTEKPPARTYPFNLDPFQRESIKCLEAGQSVLVSAHTSAGKTVVAEYAIALCLRDAQRVVYTSPIKALSNQKYRDLCEEFSDVGLMTGDVTINPNASCIVMTTEILRSMLYRGSEMIREIAWVIFDEVHYMRDRERGVVWEESIILMPDSVRFVFLSATIPNALEFAEWICKLHRQPCHVVYTDYRPTPLQHYIFPAGGDGLHLVVDDKRRFRDENFQKALATLTESKEDAAGGRIKQQRQTKGNKSDIFRIVKLIMNRNYDPCLIFCFSKRDCEANALQMSKLDLNTDDEKALVEEVFTNAIDSLGEEDKKLPQVENILPLLKRGIGLHHSGLLPILKEVVEILFQEGLLKALFSTETFSIGLNMPAKTVVFTSVRKFDGQNFRWISGGEYIQMSGRAGRRGIDDKGIVILMVDEKMEPPVAKAMLKGHADHLNSTFHLGYNMLLNLMRTEEADPEAMIKQSFHQFQADRALPDMHKALSKLKADIGEIVIEDETAVAEYHSLRQQLNKHKQQLRDVINKPEHALQFLQPGRLARVKDGDTDFGWGVVFNFQKKPMNDKKVTMEGEAFVYFVDVLLHCDTGPKPAPVKPGEDGEIKAVPVALSLLDGFSSIRVYIPKDLRPLNNRKAVLKSLLEVQKRMTDGIPLLDPIEDMKISDSGFKTLVRKVESLEDRLFTHKLFDHPSLPELYAKYDQKHMLQLEAKVVGKQIKASSSLVLRDELKAMKRVMRRLGHTNADNVIQMKGRVAAEVSAGDEIMVTELIFNGVFNETPVETCVAMLSSLICDEKAKNMTLSTEMQKAHAVVRDTARAIAKVMVESKINIDPEQYIESFKPSVMDVVYQWCKGAKFVDICKMTELFEGSIIRAMRRLEELLRQVTAAAKAIGNSDLEMKFAKGIELLRRDIVFASSLYL